MKDLGIPLPCILEEPKEPDWVYRDWLLAGDQVLVITGDPGVGKTTFIGMLMLSAASGRPFFGAHMECDPMRFAYIDLDMGEFSIRRCFRNIMEALAIGKDEAAVMDERVAIICAGMKPVPSGLDFKMDEQQGAIKKVIEQTDADVVVIESWTDICSDVVDINDAAKVSKAIKYLKAIKPGVSYWVVHHNTKSKYEAGGKNKRPAMHRGAGSYALAKEEYRMYDIAEVRKSEWTTTNVIENGKARNVPRRADFEYVYGRNPETGLFVMEKA